MWLDGFNYMRKKSGMSLDVLSEKAGVPKGTLAKITSGVTKAPALETIKSLVYAMGYTLNDLDVLDTFYDVQQGIKKAPSMSDEAVEVAVAYDGAASGIRSSVRKLLDLEAPRPKGKDYYPPFLNDAEIEEELESYRRDLIEEKRAKERLSAFKDAKDA